MSDTLSQSRSSGAHEDAAPGAQGSTATAAAPGSASRGSGSTALPPDAFTPPTAEDMAQGRQLFSEYVQAEHDDALACGDGPVSSLQADEAVALEWLEHRDDPAAALGRFWRALIALRGDGPPVVATYAVDSAPERARALACVLAVPDAHTVAYGAALLHDQPAPGRRGGSDDTAGIHGFFVDLDAKRFPDLATCLRYGQQRVSELGLRPTAVVASGHGYHIYFDLQTIWLFSSDADRQSAKSRQQGLAEFFAADSVIDMARAMRLPGTVNDKDPLHPVPCSVVCREPAAVYSPLDFAEAVTVGRPAHHRPPPAGTADPDELPPLPQGAEAEAIRDRVARLARVPGSLCRAVLLPQSLESRSEADYAVLCGLHALGWSDTDAVQAARLLRADCGDPGAKTGRADYWSTSMRNARRACGQEADSR